MFAFVFMFIFKYKCRKFINKKTLFSLLIWVIFYFSFLYFAVGNSFFVSLLYVLRVVLKQTDDVGN